MSAFGPYLRKTTRGHAHWCPGCGEAHSVPDSWFFNGSAERPTFGPSVKHTSSATRVIVDGEWTGEWKRDANGNPIPWCCHYFIENGEIKFCGDCTHDMAGKTVPLPEWPPTMREPE